mmetsp:Transcript_36813/g.85977  ORF Transcript_36813/g.85977 Transcript_36813/m.85977 type:complete len:231 (-) Transcript_36813:205-897(-)
MSLKVLKLFRDYVFHQADESGRPIMDLGHVVSSLNKLDAADPERIVLASRDGQSLLVVSYADVTRCLEGAFSDLCAGAGTVSGTGGDGSAGGIVEGTISSGRGGTNRGRSGQGQHQRGGVGRHGNVALSAQNSGVLTQQAGVHLHHRHHRQSMGQVYSGVGGMGQQMSGGAAGMISNASVGGMGPMGGSMDRMMGMSNNDGMGMGMGMAMGIGMHTRGRVGDMGQGHGHH